MRNSPSQAIDMASLIKIYIYSHFVRNPSGGIPFLTLVLIVKARKRTSDERVSIIVVPALFVKLKKLLFARMANWKADIHCYVPRTLSQDLELEMLSHFRSKEESWTAREEWKPVEIIRVFAMLRKTRHFIFLFVIPYSWNCLCSQVHSWVKNDLLFY